MSARIKRWLTAGLLCFVLLAPAALAQEPLKTEQPFVGQVPGDQNAKRPVTVLDVVVVTVGMFTGYMLPRQIKKWRQQRGRNGTDNRPGADDQS